ncbi:MAG TPA: SAM-dependent methyltransferase [Pseudonocardiaceae bacterium]|jgi:methyltransferase (TIGR00027 family)
MRTENDTWDINSSVGVTALAVAASRAGESAAPDSLVSDPFAAAFVAVAATAPNHNDGYLPLAHQLRPYLGVRTRFFDEFFAGAAAAGVEQAVILASGLDARPWRTTMPARTFEIDLPLVLDFKQQVLRDAGVAPRTEHSPVGIDLREDWGTALVRAGFSPALRTAWLAEGLLPFLPSAAQEGLFTVVDELSAPGSVIAAEEFLESMRGLATFPAMAEAVDKLGMDVPDLIFDEDAVDAGAWFTGHGWTAKETSATDGATGYGRTFDDSMPVKDAFWVTATKR